MERLFVACQDTFTGDVKERMMNCFMKGEQEAEEIAEFVKHTGNVFIENKSEKHPYGVMLIRNYNGTEYKVIDVVKINT